MQSMDETRNLLQEDGGLALAEHLMPQSFRDAGYQTWLVGKWHLGGRQNPAHLPQRRGFDHFYGFLGGTIDAYEHVDQRTGRRRLAAERGDRARTGLLHRPAGRRGGRLDRAA